VLLDVLVLLVVGCYFLTDLRLHRIEAVAEHDRRPTDGPGQDWLLVGSGPQPADRRGRFAGSAPVGAPGRRIDMLLLLHIPHAHIRPTLISLPRTAYAPLRGHGRTFGSAYALGGPRLLVSTVEGGTGIRIDRYLEFAASFPTPARGDLDRPEWQRARIEAFAERATRAGLLLNPLRGVPALRDSTRSIAVDEADHVHHLIQLAFVLRGVGTGGVVATTLPVERRGSIAGMGPVLFLDDGGIRELAVAIAGDRPLPASLLTN
jgi:anionic cell wall polymer biosynthesis LytR-Cps2A-Psr (LCP) family protein